MDSTSHTLNISRVKLEPDTIICVATVIILKESSRAVDGSNAPTYISSRNQSLQIAANLLQGCPIGIVVSLSTSKPISCAIAMCTLACAES